jgi:hypothetical protein
MAEKNAGQPPTPADKCDPNCPINEPTSGPVREAGGTTGEGNLSPAQASRTGGATGGVQTDPGAERPARSGQVPPSA